MFTPSDLAQLEARGISVEKAEKQLQSFATGFPELDIVSAASVGNGVLNPTEEEIDMYVKAWQDYLDEGHTVLKFVPASGAATFDAKWGSNQRATQDYNTIKDPAQYYELYYGALKNYWMDKKGYSEADAHVAANQTMLGSDGYGLGLNVYTLPEGQYLIGTNGKLNPNATLGSKLTYNGQEYWMQPDDYMDEAYNNSFRQEYNLNVTAGNDKSSFYASLNYLDNEGITANSDYERLAARIKADYKVKNWLKVGANMAYTHYDANSLGEDGSSGSSGNIFAYATQIAPIYPLYIRDGQGNILLDNNGFKRYDYGDGKNAGFTRPFLPGGNPYSANQLDVNNYEGNAFNANGFTLF